MLLLKLICILFLQISRNITTNEMANALRYSYLRGPGGRFRNPYDHGIRKNCTDFLIKGYNEDVELPDQTLEHSEEIGLMQMTRNGEMHSHHTSGNGHVSADVDSKSSRTHGQGHAHGPQCNSNSSSSSNSGKKHGSSNSGRNNGAPLGLGLGLGLGFGRNNVRHSSRSILPS